MMRRIEPGAKQRKPRHDIFKTRIVRAANKLPLEMVYSTNPRLVRITDYKSSEPSKFQAAFKTIFELMWSLLLERNLIQGEPSIRNYVDFISLHYPVAKIR